MGVFVPVEAVESQHHVDLCNQQEIAKMASDIWKRYEEYRHDIVKTEAQIVCLNHEITDIETDYRDDLEYLDHIDKMLRNPYMNEEYRNVLLDIQDITRRKKELNQIALECKKESVQLLRDTVEITRNNAATTRHTHAIMWRMG